MGENSAIGWTDHTFNPWWGCTKVSEGCRNCYAEGQAARFGTEWGPGKARRLFGAHHWSEPLKWNRKAQKAGQPARVFCASMADICDPEAPAMELPRLFRLIRDTPWLWWLLLTKRPERFPAILPSDWGEGYRNVMLMTTVEDQDAAEKRVATLLSNKARAYGLSCEPLIGAVDLTAINHVCAYSGEEHRFNALSDALERGLWFDEEDRCRRVNWVIAGGESGHGARVCREAWIKSLHEQCDAADVHFFFKQWGAWVPESQDAVGLSAMQDEWTGKKAPRQVDEDGNAYWKVGAEALLDGDYVEELPGLFWEVPDVV